GGEVCRRALWLRLFGSLFLSLARLPEARAHPPGMQADIVERRHRGMLEAIPVGDAPGLDMPVRDHVEAPQQHAVQPPGAGGKLLARVGVDKAFDDLVDGWVLQADEVAAARIVGTGGVPVLALFVARRVGLAEAADDHVEITRAQAVDVLRNIDTAN